MDIASLFTSKRAFEPHFYEPPMSKRAKLDRTHNQCQPQPWTWPVATSETVVDNDGSSPKRGLDDLFSRDAKRFKYSDYSSVVSEEESSFNSESIPEMEDWELEEARSQAFQKVDVLDRILGFVDSISLQRYKEVSKRWKEGCERASARRQLADPVRQFPGKEFPRLVFDARFRVQDAPRDFFPRVWHDGTEARQDFQIEISGMSWKGTLTRSFDLMDPQSNHLIKLITRNLNRADGEYHDLGIVVERGRVFLKLDNHWLPGTIPVQELAKLLGLCSWKGLPWEPSDMVEELLPTEEYFEDPDAMEE